MSAELSRRAARLLDGHTIPLRFPESIEWGARLDWAVSIDALTADDRKILEDGEEVLRKRGDL